MQENALDDRIDFQRFKEIAEQDYTADAIETFWAILNTKDASLEWITDRLMEELGEMDKHDAPYIIDLHDQIIYRDTPNND